MGRRQRNGSGGRIDLGLWPGRRWRLAFTDFGIETLTGLIEIYTADPDLLKRSSDPK